MTRFRSSVRRPGLSLLEVLIALAIFLVAMGVLGHMVNLATDRALEVQQQGEATQICQAKLAEILVGAIPLEAQSETPLDDDSPWVWSMESEQTDIAGLWRVNVRVSWGQGGNRIECAMSQMVLDPSLRGSSFDNPATQTADTAAATNTGSSSSSSTGGTTSPSTQPAGGGTGSTATKPTTGGTGTKPTTGGTGTKPTGGTGGGTTRPTTPSTPTTPGGSTGTPTTPRTTPGGSTNPATKGGGQ